MSESPRLIHRITPKNILSFGPECSGIELGSLNLLIGPNGSGKSNLIEVIDLMRASPKDYADVTRRGGGIQDWIWKGLRQHSGDIEVIHHFTRECPHLSHFIDLQSANQQFSLIDEAIFNSSGNPVYLRQGTSGDGPEAEVKIREEDGGGKKWTEAPIRHFNRSVLGQLRDAARMPELAHLTDAYEQIRIYREWALGRNTVFREPQRADMRRDRLEEDFSNLGLFLNRLKTEFPAAKRTLLKALQDLYDGITDFEVNTNGGTVQVFLHEGDFAIPATRLSDGTLRYLCLLAILCDPEPPPLICIEEPELGLHPDILPGLADLLRTASERTQLIVTTHSDILVDAMTETPECVIVCEKHEGQTEMKRLDAGELSVWLQKYRLGQLWIDGQLGGKRW
ncbi:MAG: AAA family ATPase [Prosthecobacter sp.]|uniref:AAA family ATPase n=1 Tax=Prosthecobacter sp. TaxID=1965333 RepID=UPI0039010063